MRNARLSALIKKKKRRLSWYFRVFFFLEYRGVELFFSYKNREIKNVTYRVCIDNAWGFFFLRLMSVCSKRDKN